MFENEFDLNLQCSCSLEISVQNEVSHPLFKDYLKNRIRFHFSHLRHDPSFSEMFTIAELLDAIVDVVHSKEIRNSGKRVLVLHKLIRKCNAAFFP